MKKNNESPNILLLTIDCLRPDHLGCYNAEMRNISPNIDNIGKKGVLFTHAFSQGPTTSMAFPSIITGTYPLSYGGPSYLINERPHIAEILSKHGFHCIGFQTNYWLSYQHNYPRGFEEYFEFYKLTQKLRINLLREIKETAKRYYSKDKEDLHECIKNTVLNQLHKLKNGYTEYLESVSGRSVQIKNEIMEIDNIIDGCKKDMDQYLQKNIGIDIDKFMLSEKKNRKFYVLTNIVSILKQVVPASMKWFLKENFIKSNYDFKTKEKPYLSADILTKNIINWINNHNKCKPFFMWAHYMDVHAPYLPGSGDNWPVEMNEYIDSTGGPSISEREAYYQKENIRSYLYNACINYVDHNLKKIVSILNKLERNTIVIITSDHGEEFWEHGDNNHLAKLYDELVRIPLIFYDTKQELFVDESVNDLIGHIDILPILIEILELSTHSQLCGQNILKKPRYFVVSETLQKKSRSDSWNGEDVTSDYKIISVRTKNEKLIYFERENCYEYYDLKNDQKEQNPVKFKEEPVRLSRLNNIISDRLDNIQKHCDMYGNSFNYLSNSKNTELIEKNLKALGYL